MGEGPSTTRSAMISTAAFAKVTHAVLVVALLCLYRFVKIHTSVPYKFKTCCAQLEVGVASGNSVIPESIDSNSRNI